MRKMPWDWLAWTAMSVVAWWYDAAWYLSFLAGWLLGGEARAVLAGGTLSQKWGVWVEHPLARWVGGVHYAFLAAVKLPGFWGFVVAGFLLVWLPAHWLLMRGSERGHE